MLGGGVVVPIDLRIFEILIVIQPAEELQLVDVVVGLALGILRLLGPRGDADGVPDVQAILELKRDRALADARRAAENDQRAAMIRCAPAHSTFCTCSLTRSIAPLISTM